MDIKIIPVVWGGGNVSCIKANIGDSDKDGSDDYLEKEINLCEF